MRHPKRRCMAALLGATLLWTLPAGAQAQDALAQIRQAGVLRIGTETAFAPFDFIQDGRHVGFNVDLFQEVGKELGVKLQWIPLPWTGVLPGLEVRKFDLVGGPATITRERMARYRFTPPVAEATLALLKRKGDSRLMAPQDIGGKPVGVAKATAQLAQLKTFAEGLPSRVDIREYPGNSEAYADLAAGRVVAAANSLPNLSYVASQRPDTFEVLKPPIGVKTYFGYIGRKDAHSATLMDAVEEALLKIKRDGRMARLQTQWFGESFETPDLVTEPAI